MNDSRNVAARMGRWSAQHRKIAIFGWFGFVAVAFALGIVLGTEQLDPARPGSKSGASTGSWPTSSKLRDRAGDDPVRNGHRQLHRVQGCDQRRCRSAEAGTRGGHHRLGPRRGALELISADGHTALVDVEIVGDPDDAVDKIGRRHRVKAGQDAHSFTVESFGVTAEDQVNSAFADALKKAGELSIPLTIGILLLAFGSLVAAGLPVLLALTAVIATMGLLAIPSQLPLDQSIGALVLLIGLAVGVDYSMFYIKREREERAAGKGEQAAAAAAATSGRSVLISGLTVMIAMAGLLLTGDPTFAGFGIATIMVVAVAVLGSLTVLPALLSKLGDRVDKGGCRSSTGSLRRDGEGRLWSAILGPVLRYPLVSMIAAAIPLVALGLIAFQMKLAQPGPETFPSRLPAVQTYNKLQEAFPGGAIPATVVIKADNVRKPEIKRRSDSKWRALVYAGMHEPIVDDVNREGTIQVVSIPVPDKATDKKAFAALESLREVVPRLSGSSRA